MLNERQCCLVKVWRKVKEESLAAWTIGSAGCGDVKCWWELRKQKPVSSPALSFVFVVEQYWRTREAWEWFVVEQYWRTREAWEWKLPVTYALALVCAVFGERTCWHWAMAWGSLVPRLIFATHPQVNYGSTIGGSVIGCMDIVYLVYFLVCLAIIQILQGQYKTLYS